MKIIQTIFIVITLIWYVGFIGLILYLNRKYNREFEINFNKKYYSKIPSSLNPCELSLLLYKKIISETMSAVIQFLIIKKYLIVEEVDRDYLIYSNYGDKKISKSQEFLMKFLICEIGNNQCVSLDDIYKFCDTNKNATIFLNNYQLWKKLIVREGKNEFYVDKTEYELIRKYKNIAMLIFILNFIFHFFAAYFIPIFAYFLLYYFYKIFKRTKKATEEYYKWHAFKNYLTDNELSNIVVLEDKQKYLLYATMLRIDREVNKKLDNNVFITKLNNTINRAIIKAMLYGNRGYFK